MRRGRVIVAAVVLVVVGAAGLVLRSGDVDRDEYVRDNVRLLASLPVYPGARAVETSSSPCTDGDSAGADVVAAVVLVVVGAAGLVLRSGDVDRDEYVRDNLRLLASLPVYPGARATETSSSRCIERDAPAADVVAYWTSRRYALPRGASRNGVAEFFQRRLASWRVDAGGTLGDTPYLSFRSGPAYVHVLPGDGVYFVGVQHDYRACY